MNLLSAVLNNLARGSDYKLKLGKVRWDSRKNCFTWEMKVMSVFVIQRGLSCANVDMGASSTVNGLAQVCTRVELSSRPEQRYRAEFFEVMACCQNTEFAMRDKQSCPTIWCCLLNGY